MQQSNTDGRAHRLRQARSTDLPVGQITSHARKPVQPPRKKYFAFSETQISCSVRTVPARSRGAYRDRHGRWAWDAVDAAATRDERRTKRTAKACGPGAPTLALRFAGLSSRNDGGKRARSPGRARISRKTIAQGRPDDCGVPVVANACAFYTAHAAAGATRTRSSLRPLILEGRFSCTTRTHRAARMRWCVFSAL